MAYLPDEETQAIIRDKGLPKLSTNTITNPEDLKKELTRIRERGYSMSHGETDQGAWGVAVPVWDSNGEVVAGIGVAGPSSRHTDQLAQRYVDLCGEAAGKITAILSGETVDEGLGLAQ
jgi:DNA-binding IclR family transcriptional regulator